MYPCFFFQSVADMVQSYGLFVMFHRIWCTSNAIAPPVIDGTSIHRCILHFIPDLVIQFLKRHHMHGDFFAIFFIKQRNRICNGRVDRRIIRKNAGNTGDIEIVRITVFFIFLYARSQIRVQIFQKSCHITILFAEVVFRHKINIFVQNNAEGISQVIMLTIPYQQTLSVLIFPEIRFLVLIQRIHAVMGMDIGIQKFYSVFDQGIALSHGDTINICNHGCFDLDSFFAADFLHRMDFFFQIFAVGKIIKVQIIGRQTDVSFFYQIEKLFFFFLRCHFEKLLHAVPCLTVPFQIFLGCVVFDSIFNQFDRPADVVCLIVDNLLLQIGVTHVSVGMMYDVDFSDFVCHDNFSFSCSMLLKIFISLYPTDATSILIISPSSGTIRYVPTAAGTMAVSA